MRRRRRYKVIIQVLFTMILTAFWTSAAFSGDVEQRLDMLEKTLKMQQIKIEEQQRIIDRLREEVNSKQQPLSERQPTGTVNRKEVAEAETPRPGKVSSPATEKSQVISGVLGDTFKGAANPYITFVLNSLFYSSSVDEKRLRNRGISGFSSIGYKEKKGFNLEEGSISLFAPVDQYFDLFGVVSFNETEACLEEGYFYTKTLPAGLRLKGGKFRSSFSGHNELHPHEWDFADTALIYRGFMGREGINEKGAQLLWRPPLTLQPLLGVEILHGENPVLFNKDSTGGPHAFTAYAKGFYNISEKSGIYFGPYAITGKTRTGSVENRTFFRGNSSIYGFETSYRWRPSEDRSLTILSEYMWRRQDGDLARFVADTTNRFTRSQDGIYIQSLYQMGRWRIGARFDRLNLFSDTYSIAGTPERFGNPWRLTGALEFNPSEYSRFRLQYNYDRSGGAAAYGNEPKINHEVYLQMIFGIGAHIEPTGQREL